MPQQVTTSVENNFTKGLITEATGLNFPENAATDTDNCTYTLIGDVTRRQGIDYEDNFHLQTIDINLAQSSYKWNNAGGDGGSQIVVIQAGSLLYFYKSSSASVAFPLSSTYFSKLDITDFSVGGVTFDPTQECQYADGNGYLFVYHPDCDPFYVSYDGVSTVAGNGINIQIRDTTGIFENIPVNFRPSTLTKEHSYNIRNQGWTAGSPWSATSGTSYPVPFATGSHTFIVTAGIVGLTIGQVVAVNGTFPGSGLPAYINASGTITAYSGSVVTINISTVSQNIPPRTPPCSTWTIAPTNTGYINTWVTAEGKLPSNADVWWYFKNSAGVFDPATTQPNVSLSVGNAPQGHYLLNAFNQDRSAISGVNSLTVVSTTARPTTGAWFQGRVWYTGVNASQQATGDALYYTWSENIYFSQVCLSNAVNFGNCFQTNDPTSETLFDILPTDGGIIQIPGSGRVYKLFPIQNGMLVFAANGIWFITGSQGIGFSANDYTITKISSVQSISSTSFVDVQGLPFFWNEEGIYAVTPGQNGGLTVEPLTVGTIETFYDNIPTASKRYVRGAYHPIDYVIQWTYRKNTETGIADRYHFDGILNYNTYNKAFYPYSVSNTSPSINGIIYVNYPGTATSPDAGIKYLSSTNAASNNFTFSDEHDESYTDWSSGGTPNNFSSYFVTGYKLRGQAIKKFQPQYIQVYSRQNGAASSYKIQGIWDYANSRSSGRWTGIQVVTNALTRFDTIFRRHKIRGHGYVLQFKILSVDGMPFDIQGWAVVDTVNTGT